ncbi:hypothetical protein IEQ34_006604 [Dendrobium chrysotoxum]|uniref:Uncharacterized protein n=1 Tax=Dendrobium chrysotoxum TaxID=161865 RepID=A0AAV7H8L6_DENCH|nr:hypothetical protein IEQ34_006604 [Dendrobium chrysotoxum]
MGDQFPASRTKFEITLKIMVIVAPIASSMQSSTSTIQKHPILAPQKNDASSNPSWRPLIPSEKDNAAMSRRPHVKETSFRYLSSYSSSIRSTSYLSSTSMSSSFSPSFR